MSTLIIPCAGKSSRFPGMKPKWLLTHPDGKLMIEKAIEGMALEQYDQIVITIVQRHIDQHDALNVLRDTLGGIPKLKFCVLPDFTSSASETIVRTIEALKISGPVSIKDSDNFIAIDLPSLNKNFIVGLRISQDSDITNIQNKSFLRVNEHGIVVDIIEKRIVSDIICVGMYHFDDAQKILNAYYNLINSNFSGELYISHLVSYLLCTESEFFKLVLSKKYSDWGTSREWKLVQRQFATYFIDFDGVLIKNSGRFGVLNWDNNDQLLLENCQVVSNKIKEGAQVIITTARPEKYRARVLELLRTVGIKPYQLIMGLNHAPRCLINDFAPSNPYPSAICINLPRDGNLHDYLS